MIGWWWISEYENHSRRIKAWAAHYETKGCTAEKAYRVARDKVASSRTWPPTHQPVDGDKLSR